MSVRTELPSLMGGRVEGHDLLRTARVQDGALSTLVIPSDWVSQARRDELFEGGGSFVPTTGNDVDYLHSGRETFGEIADLLRQTQPGDYVLLLGWLFDYWLRLERGHDAPGLTGEAYEHPGHAGRLLIDAAARGVSVNLLLWAGSTRAEAARGPLAGAIGGLASAVIPLPVGERVRSAVHDRLELAGMYQARLHPQIKADLERPNLRVVLDSNTHTIGAHHMKLLCVKRGPDLVVFYGGMDINRDRLEIYDLHARAVGPVAMQLDQLARQRFAVSSGTEQDRAAVAALPAPGEQPPRGGSHALVTRTLMYQRPGVYEPVSDIEPMLENVIRHARRFIYVEDQYFWTRLGEEEHGMIDLLAEQLSRVHHITVVTNDDPQQGTEQVANRHAALARLLRRSGALHYKLGVFCYPGRFVHPKLWIVDDEIAICGSANFAPRSYQYDTELMVSEISRVDRSWHSLGLSHARRLRMRVWADHLGIHDRARLADGVSSVAYFRRVEQHGDHSEGARIRSYYIHDLPWRQAVAEGRIDWRGPIDRGANG